MRRSRTRWANRDRIYLVRMLVDRDGLGDRDKARALIGEAIGMYRAIGMPKHLAMVEELAAEL